MKSAIVTGANGFIGKAVCKVLLENGVKTYAIVRDRNSMSDLLQYEQLVVEEADFATYNLLPKKMKEPIDVFYHFSWEGAFGSILSDYTQQIKNIQYTCDTISIAHEIGCNKFIMAGTINELELMQFFHAEQQVPRPACIYGIAKLACDLMCKTIAADFGIQYNTAIIGSCFGPGDKSKRIHNAFISSMIHGVKPKLVEATNLHDWIYIDDVADMFYAIGCKSVNMKNYYIGHNKLRVLKDILLEVRDILNPEMVITFGEVKAPFLIDYSLVDINSVYEDTDYKCNSIFKECIVKTAEWVKGQGM